MFRGLGVQRLGFGVESLGCGSSGRQRRREELLVWGRG